MARLAWHRVRGRFRNRLSEANHYTAEGLNPTRWGVVGSDGWTLRTLSATRRCYSCLPAECSPKWSAPVWSAIRTLAGRGLRIAPGGLGSNPQETSILVDFGESLARWPKA